MIEEGCLRGYVSWCTWVYLMGRTVYVTMCLGVTVCICCEPACCEPAVLYEPVGDTVVYESSRCVGILDLILQITS